MKQLVSESIKDVLNYLLVTEMDGVPDNNNAWFILYDNLEHLLPLVIEQENVNDNSVVKE